LFYLNFEIEKKSICHPSSFSLTTPAAAAAIASRQALSKEKNVGKEKGKKRLLISTTILNDGSKETLVMQR